MKRIAPLFTARWWLLHAFAIAAVYTVGRLVLGR